MQRKLLPIGIESFEKFKENNYYYVDKTGFIKELLNNLSAVNLFTRPRRFGKSLNMDMLKCFFEIGKDKSLFAGLAIANEKELCDKYMGQYPVIAISLKDVEGLSFADAKYQFENIISAEVRRHIDRMSMEALDNIQRKILADLSLTVQDVKSSIKIMTELLYKYYQRKIIILIDEYDVPLQKAELNGYYPEIVNLISGFFSQSMKTNPYMEFAVVTGCLRISKESIFTGFNNPKIHTVLDEQYDEWFGFTDAEVQEMLAYYDKSEYYELTKEWYNGYTFGLTKVYNPWDVLNWCYKLCNTTNPRPEAFWLNTSGNNIIKRFADLADGVTRSEIESLLNGGSVLKIIDINLTYGELDKSIANLWSVLVMTGYLTYKQRVEDAYELVIPNREVKLVLERIFDEWFKEKVQSDEYGLEAFFAALDAGNVEDVQDYLNAVLLDCISFYDGGMLQDKETFYHGFLLGVLRARKGWETRSNREAGHGRLDIVTEPRMRKTATIFELKYADSVESLEQEAQVALEQIQARDYDAYFKPFKRRKIIHYGIAFNKKQCRVVGEVIE